MKLVFINGQSGTGKTTLVRWFEDHPVAGWLFLDFDDGKFVSPKELGTERQRQWKIDQHNWFLEEVARIHREQGLNVCVLGGSLFSWKAQNLPAASLVPKENIHYGFLVADPAVRCERLAERGDDHLFEPDPARQQQFVELAERNEREGAKRFDTNQSVEAVANDIREWLESL